jgi:hypothetical protein
LATPKVLANKDNLLGNNNKESLKEILYLQFLALLLISLNIFSLEIFCKFINLVVSVVESSFQS